MTSDALGIQGPSWRWPVALGAVIAAHVCVVMLLHRPASPLMTPSDAPIAIDLLPAEEPAPTPEAEPEPAPPQPTPPEPVKAEPPPPEPIVTPEVPPPVEPPPPEQVAEEAPELPDLPVPPMPMPAPAAPVRPKVVTPPRPIQPRPVPQPTTPTPTTTVPPTTPAAPSAASQAAASTWQSRLLAHLERHKRYPPEAMMRRQEGVPMVRFTMTRNGNVLSAHLVRGSGHDSLDREALAWLERAKPLPPLPADMPDAEITLVVPLRFQLR